MSKSSRFNLQGRLLASPRTTPGSDGPIALYVSICKADYWLPQVSGSTSPVATSCSFNLQGRLLASPSQADRRLKRGQVVSICKADYWLPQGRGNRQLCRAAQAVSICKADYWLPQGDDATSGSAVTTVFQSARQIIGFPKQAMRLLARLRPGTCFNLQGRLLASPRAWALEAKTKSRCFNLQGRLLASPRTIHNGTSVSKYKFQSARQIIGFPKSAARA